MRTRQRVRKKKIKKEKGQLLLESGVLIAMSASLYQKHWSSGVPGTDFREKHFSSAQYLII